MIHIIIIIEILLMFLIKQLLNEIYMINMVLSLNYFNEGNVFFHVSSKICNFISNWVDNILNEVENLPGYSFDSRWFVSWVEAEEGLRQFRRSEVL